MQKITQFFLKADSVILTNISKNCYVTKLITVNWINLVLQIITDFNNHK